MNDNSKSLYRFTGLLLISTCILSGLQPLAAAKKNELLAMTNEQHEICQQAEGLINSGNFKQAIQILSKAQSLDPACPEIHGYLGMAYQNSMNPEKAISEYQQALQLNPQMSFINVNLGSCLMNMGQLNQALPYFQKYLQENPNAADAAQVRAYIQQAGARQSQQNLRSSVENGQALLNQHKFKEAATAFQQAISEQPNFAPSHFYLGYALAQMGQHQQAINEFKRALALDPSMKEATMNIASNYQSLGDCPNAISWYEKYLQENSSSPKVADIQQRIKGLKQQMQQQGATQGQDQSPGSALNSSISPGTENGDYFAAAVSGGKVFHWMRMPVRVLIMNGSGIAGYRDAYFQMLMDAFSIWAKGSDNRLAFSLANDPSQADIICEWTADQNRIMESGRSLEGGLTKLSAQAQPGGDAAIVKAQMTILTHRSGQPLSDDEMKKVCLHEVGHALGINGHSSDNHDIMFFSESPSIWPALTKRDKATINRIYSNYPQFAQ
ncbi:MAG: tetratricopeptide repeat protein [Candidatus Obscuribacterales bacterium]|nr:tetratricopeptide repeat protein [Candidatus Obscuribacterales bacterium]